LTNVLKRAIFITEAPRKRPCSYLHIALKDPKFKFLATAPSALILAMHLSTVDVKALSPPVPQHLAAEHRLKTAPPLLAKRDAAAAWRSPHRRRHPGFARQVLQWRRKGREVGEGSRAGGGVAPRVLQVGSAEVRVERGSSPHSVY
jgi:hypothetical protein